MTIVNPFLPSGVPFMVRQRFGQTYLAKIKAIPNAISILPLNDTSGTTAVDAVLGTNSTYNGTYTLADLAGPGASMGKGVKLDGTSGYVQLAASALNSVFSISAGTLAIWAYLNEALSVNDVLLQAVVGADDNNRIEVVKNGVSTETFYSARGGTANERDASLSTAGWHHVAVTWDTSVPAMIGYIDGVKQGATVALSGTWTGSLASNHCRVGSYNNSAFWKGWLMFFALYSIAQPQSVITSLATAQ